MKPKRSPARIYRPTITRGRGTRNLSSSLEPPANTRTAHSRAPAHTRRSQSVSRQPMTSDPADRNDNKTTFSTDFGSPAKRPGIPQVDQNASIDPSQHASYVHRKSPPTDVSLAFKSRTQNANFSLASATGSLIAEDRSTASTHICHQFRS